MDNDIGKDWIPYPLQLAEDIMDYDNCNDGIIDESAELIREMYSLLRQVYDQCGNDQPAVRRHTLTPGLRDSIRDLLHKC